MTILKICIVVVVGVILQTLLRQVKPEFGNVITLFLCVVFLLWETTDIKQLFVAVNDMSHLCGEYSVYFSVLFKMIGISYISDFTVGICKDNGMTAVSGCVEIITKILLCIISLPVMKTVIYMIADLS